MFAFTLIEETTVPEPFKPFSNSFELSWNLSGIKISVKKKTFKTPLNFLTEHTEIYVTDSMTGQDH